MNWNESIVNPDSPDSGAVNSTDDAAPNAFLVGESTETLLDSSSSALAVSQLGNIENRRLARRTRRAAWDTSGEDGPIFLDCDEATGVNSTGGCRAFALSVVLLGSIGQRVLRRFLGTQVRSGNADVLATD